MAGLKLVDHGFQSAADHYKMRQGVVRISTGSRELDSLLGGKSRAARLQCSAQVRLGQADALRCPLDR